MSLRQTAAEGGRPPAELIDLVGSEAAIPPLLANPGATFEHGLFRIHNEASYSSVVPPLRHMYAPEELIPFAFDWLGRQFTLRGPAQIVVCDGGWNDKLVADSSLTEFVDEVIPDEGHDLLRVDLWSAVRKTSPAGLAFDECFGYDTPVFLGGLDEAANLGRTSLHVYWDVLSQLAAQVDSLPDGTTIDRIDIASDD
jgi:hypothetical protein